MGAIAVHQRYVNAAATPLHVEDSRLDIRANVEAASTLVDIQRNLRMAEWSTTYVL